VPVSEPTILPVRLVQASEENGRRQTLVLAGARNTEAGQALWPLPGLAIGVSRRDPWMVFGCGYAVPCFRQSSGRYAVLASSGGVRGWPSICHLFSLFNRAL